MTGLRALPGNLPDEPSTGEPPGPSVVVAGHLCLDIILRLAADPERHALAPGSLEIVGPTEMAVGGCVGNTGIALHRLGLRTTLVARLGDDRFGAILGDLVRTAIPATRAHLIVTPGGSTSYSLVHNRAGEDRAIQHFPGVNGAFVATDVPTNLLEGTTLLHVGYPPLMAALVADGGRELQRLLVAAHAGGVMTSLDMANVDADPGDSPVDWRALLQWTLPEVDIFLPSLDEACHLLGRTVDRDDWGSPLLASVGRLADEMVERGVAIAGVKLGERGLFLRSGSSARIAAVPSGPSPVWADRELRSPVFETKVVGTTGAGDATIAGFLFGLLSGMGPADSLRAACAVGGFSTEAADGTSGVPRWSEVEARLRHGWRRANGTPEAGWTGSPDTGVWIGPRDGSPPRPGGGELSGGVGRAPLIA